MVAAVVVGTIVSAAAGTTATGYGLRAAVRRLLSLYWLSPINGGFPLVIACSLLSLGAVARADTHAVIIAGLGGESQYEQRFRNQATSLAQAAEKLTGDKARVSVLSAEKADRESVRRQLRTLAANAKREDQVLIVLIGHGSYDGEDYRFNLPGPDLTASELGALFDQIPARDQLIVNSTSASGAAIDRWQRDNRVVITSTRSGNEKTATRFAQYWVDAVSTNNADTNRDDVVTAAEAFEFANRKVAESFKSDVSLATEHARLEGKGSERFQVARFGNAILATSDSALNSLYTQRGGIERDLEMLKERKPSLETNAYYDQLEGVLVRLAMLQKEIDQRQTTLGGGRR
jgi:Peptidase C13 family